LTVALVVFSVRAQEGQCVDSENGDCINPDAVEQQQQQQREALQEESVQEEPEPVPEPAVEEPIISETAPEEIVKESLEPVPAQDPEPEPVQEEEEEQQQPEPTTTKQEEAAAEASSAATTEEINTPNCPSRKHVIACAAKYLDKNENGLLERSELQGAIDKLPWLSRGLLKILGSVDKMMTKCDMDGDDAISIGYDMDHNAETCLATCFKRRAFKSAFFAECEVE